MINFTQFTAALALGLALAAATPALAVQRSYHPGHAARAQAVPAEQAVRGAGGVSSARAKAIPGLHGHVGRFHTAWLGHHLVAGVSLLHGRPRRSGIAGLHAKPGRREAFGLVLAAFKVSST